MKWTCGILYRCGQFSLWVFRNLSFLCLWVKYVAVVFQHLFEGFSWIQKSVKTYIVIWLEVFINWADEKEGGYNESRQNLDCSRHNSQWYTSEQYMKAVKNWKDEIISYFNTKDCLGIFLSKGEIWPSVWAHKSIKRFKHACSFRHYWKRIPQP